VKGRDGAQVIGALETIGWIIVAAVTAWGLTLAHATSAIGRLDASRRREIQYWKDKTARARAHAAQVSQDAAAWAAGNKQGRDEVISMMPLIMAAKDPSDTGPQDTGLRGAGPRGAAPNGVGSESGGPGSAAVRGDQDLAGKS
jgi:hypothetical protein